MRELGIEIIKIVRAIILELYKSFFRRGKL